MSWICLYLWGTFYYYYNSTYCIFSIIFRSHIWKYFLKLQNRWVGVWGEGGRGWWQHIYIYNKTPSHSLASPEFQVSIETTGSQVMEGNDVTLTCVHNLHNLTVILGWRKDGIEIDQQKNKTQLLQAETGQYICYVNSSCGFYKSSPHDVTVTSK